MTENWANAISTMVAECYGRSYKAGWYHDPKTHLPIERNVGEMIALIHSELSEADEGARMNSPDDYIPHRKAVEVELADAVIRIFDLSGHLRLDLGGAYAEKLGSSSGVLSTHEGGLERQSSVIREMVFQCYARTNSASSTGDAISMIHSDVSKALEGVRKNSMHSLFPHRRTVEVELAAALIRICDLCGHLKLDLGGAYADKLRYNETRADHKREARADGGKAF